MSKIGIYMPCYNVEDYIQQSIESIINQTHKDWEMVIIDDCSTDSTPEKISNISDERINVFKREKHAGKIGVVKNEAINKLSKDCEFICHVGSDDLISNNCFELYVDFMNKNPDIGAACGSFECFDNSGKKWRYPHVHNREFNPDTLLSYMNLFPMRFYRRETIEMVGGYSNELSSAVDYDLALKISEKVKIRRLIEPVTYFYRRHYHQASTKGKTEQDSNAKTALQNAIKRRGLDVEITNDVPPFNLQKKSAHFIWGKK